MTEEKILSVEDLLQKKQELESKIAALLKTFREETDGISITKIDIQSKSANISCGWAVWFEVNAEITL